MTTIDTHVGANAAGSRGSFFAGLGSWVTSGDHKRIGRMWLGSALVFTVATLVVGALIGLERMSPADTQFVPDDAILQLVNVHRFALVLAVLAPLFVGISLAVVPMQLGSRAVAFPRLAQYGLWTWLLGVVLYVVALAGNGGPGGGNHDLVDLSLLAMAVAALGIMAGAVSVAVTVMTSRAPGMSLDRVPVFSWAALAGATATLLSLPVTIGNIVYLYVDHSHANVAFGGNDALGSWLHSSLTQPQTIVFAIMALGVVAEIAPVAGRNRQPARGAVLVGLGLVSVSALGAVTQTQHVLSWTGSVGDKVSSLVLFLLFSGLPVLGVLAVLGASALAIGGSVQTLRAPFVLAASGALMILAGLTGGLVGNIEKVGVSGTVFEEGVLLYIVLGTVLSALGALAHWAPKLHGRVIDDGRLGIVAAVGLFGAIAAALPLYVAGLQEQPSDLLGGFDYDGPIKLWNGLSALGLVLVVVAVVGFLALVLSRKGEKATDDPWDGHTLEWAIPSPAPRDNFAELALVGSPEPLLDAKPSSREVAS